MLKKDIQNALKKSEAKPSKRFGQNFLISEKKIEEIVEAADIQPSDTIIEIGPGVGNLTQKLAKKAKKIIAIEKDGDMVKILKETLKDCNNIEIIQSDILKINSPLLASGEEFPPPQSSPSTEGEEGWGREIPVANIGDKYKVVANLPFYVASAIIRKFLEAKNPPELMVLTVQKEVGQRICATPPNMSLLAISVQFYAEAKIVSYISKKLFWPAPKVDSAIIKLQHREPEVRPRTIRPRSDLGQAYVDWFFKIVKAGFSQPRKQLANNLAKGLKIEKQKIGKWLAENNIKSGQRAETLSLENWVMLAASLNRNL